MSVTGVERRPPRRRGKPGFSTYEGGFGRETDSPLERKGFEPSVPRRGPTVVDITPPTAPTFFGALAEDWDWRILQSWRLTPRLALGPDDDEGRSTGDADFCGLAACALDSSRFRVTASASSCSAASCALAVSRACSAACAAACNPAAVARAVASRVSCSFS